MTYYDKKIMIRRHIKTIFDIQINNPQGILPNFILYSFKLVYTIVYFLWFVVHSDGGLMFCK